MRRGGGHGHRPGEEGQGHPQEEGHLTDTGGDRDLHIDIGHLGGQGHHPGGQGHLLEGHGHHHKEGDHLQEDQGHLQDQNLEGQGHLPDTHLEDNQSHRTHQVIAKDQGQDQIPDLGYLEVGTNLGHLQ